MIRVCEYTDATCTHADYCNNFRCYVEKFMVVITGKSFVFGVDPYPDWFNELIEDNRIHISYYEQHKDDKEGQGDIVLRIRDSREKVVGYAWLGYTLELKEDGNVKITKGDFPDNRNTNKSAANR